MHWLSAHVENCDAYPSGYPSPEFWGSGLAVGRTLVAVLEKLTAGRWQRNGARGAAALPEAVVR